MKVFCFLFLSFLTLLIHVTAGNKNLKLLFVQILYRHGDRAPISLYPNDPNPETFWPEGLAKLTKLGRKEHYGLGKSLRSMYKDFMTSSPLEIKVTSSETDRCLKSAQTNLASFFIPRENWRFEKNVNWQPISIHYIPKDDDKYLETDSYCPRAEEEKQRVINSPEGKKFIAKHQKMFDNLTYYSGTSITEWTSASYLHDTLWIEKRYNLTVPQWAEPYWEELQEVSALSFFWSFNSPLLHRLRAGPLLQEILENMKEKIAGNLQNLKFHVYSGHDTNVAVVLDSLNLFNMKQPPYCASLLFELYEGPDDSSFVRLLFLNSTEPETASQKPHVLVLEGCEEFCPLYYFINFTRQLMPGDWKQECQITKSFMEKVWDQETSIGIIFLIVFSIMIMMSFIAVWRKYRHQRDSYAYHLMPIN